MTSICDERGQELLYAGVPITEVFKEDLGIGGVLGLLWFQRRSVYRSLLQYVIDLFTDMLKCIKTSSSYPITT